MMRKNTKTVGAEGESVVSLWLEKNEYKIIARNWRTAFGEIDIIAEKEKTVVFVEVKTLLTTNLENLDIIINKKKQMKICLTAKHFLQINRQYNSADVRFDVIVLQSNPFLKQTPKIFHIKHAFGDCDE